MNEQFIAEFLRRVAAQTPALHATPVEKLSLELTTVDLQMDSLDVLELIMFLEDEYDISIHDDETTNVTTLGGFAELVHTKVSSGT